MFRKRWQIITVLNGREVYPVPEHHKFYTHKGAYRYVNSLHKVRQKADLGLANLDYLIHPIVRVEDM
jgi:hypothetical protein